MSGQIYVIRDERNAIKIGFSESVHRRLAAFRTVMSSNFHVECVVNGSRERESDLHRSVSASKIKGEWFNYTEEVRNLIETLKAEAVPVVCPRPAPDEFTARAASWARSSEEWLSSRNGSSIRAARKIFAAMCGVTHGLLENLQRGRVVEISAAAYRAIGIGHTQCLADKITCLTAKLKEAQSAPCHSADFSALEAAMAKARKMTREP